MKLWALAAVPANVTKAAAIKKNFIIALIIPTPLVR
jgi:hypothetical protein